MGDVLFKKKKRGPISAPQPPRVNERDNRDDNGDDDDGPAVVLKEKRKTINPLRQSTAPSLKRQRRDNAGSGDESDSDLYELDRFSETRTRATGSTTSANRNRDDAVRHSDWDLEQGADAPGLASSKSAASNEDGLYRGAGGYTNYLPQRDDGSSSKMRSRGPIRSTTTVRSSTVMDYQPDICKDYKETGYCGFGDTCKFLHDRSDYLAGWQLDVLPNSNARDIPLSDPENGEDDDEEDIPFACLICRQPFTDPVVTTCGHYFCSACAIKRYSKNPKCFACGAQTNGLFNSAAKLIQRMQKLKERKAHERSERRRALGLDHDGDDGDGPPLDGVEIGGAERSDDEEQA